jgi:hypothetical protein
VIPGTLGIEIAVDAPSFSMASGSRRAAAIALSDLLSALRTTARSLPIASAMADCSDGITAGERRRPSLDDHVGEFDRRYVRAQRQRLTERDIGGEDDVCGRRHRCRDRSLLRSFHVARHDAAVRPRAFDVCEIDAASPANLRASGVTTVPPASRAGP